MQLPTLPTLDRTTFHTLAGKSLPRHVSYPMPTWWHALEPGEADTLRSLSTNADLSLYLHVPFCQKLCKFCACNKSILRRSATGMAETVERFLQAIEREIDQAHSRLAVGRVVRQIHWGGGTPTYLTVDQIRRLHHAYAQHVSIAPDAEISLEVDPRVTTKEQLIVLRELGFNRVSMGVQDFNHAVQEHVQRIQPLEMVAECVHHARDAGFASINFDLIYGLPYQTPQSVSHTVDQTIDLSPDRIAFYHYAQIPDRIATQRGIHHDAMPDSDTKLDMLLDAHARFTAAGYDFIGLDHFAKKSEGLAQSLVSGTITRNFQGMTTGRSLDLIGFGPSAISTLPGKAFWQNLHEHTAYADAVFNGEDPARRGMALSREDAIRQHLLINLYAAGFIDMADVERRFDLSFEQHFTRELRECRELHNAGLITIDDDARRIELTFPLGRVLMRNVAAVFDAYLPPNAWRQGMEASYSANA